VDLTPYVDRIRRELVVATELAGAEAAAVAERLLAAVESSVRLALLDALGAAAEELTRDLAPATVDLRLRGGEPDFVVTLPPETEPADVGTEPVPGTGAGEEREAARVTLRLPEHLKARIDETAAQQGLSVNAWLVRTLQVAVSGRGGRRGGFLPVGQSITGWAR